MRALTVVEAVALLVAIDESIDTLTDEERLAELAGRAMALGFASIARLRVLGAGDLCEATASVMVRGLDAIGVDVVGELARWRTRDAESDREAAS